MKNEYDNSMSPLYISSKIAEITELLVNNLFADGNILFVFGLQSSRDTQMKYICTSDTYNDRDNSIIEDTDFSGSTADKILKWKCIFEYSFYALSEKIIFWRSAEMKIIIPYWFVHKQ